MEEKTKVGRIVKGKGDTNNIYDIHRPCALCGESIIQSTANTKEKREKQKYCSNTCKKNAIRTKNPSFGFTTLNRKQKEAQKIVANFKGKKTPKKAGY